MPDRKARPRRTDLEGIARKALSGVALSWLLLLLPASCPLPFKPASLFARVPDAYVAIQEK